MLIEKNAAAKLYAGSFSAAFGTAFISAFLPPLTYVAFLDDEAY